MDCRSVVPNYKASRRVDKIPEQIQRQMPHPLLALTYPLSAYRMRACVTGWIDSPMRRKKEGEP